MMSGQLQTRWVMNNNKGRRGDAANDSDNQWGFQVRRAKVRFQGNVIDPSWTYAINGSFEGPDNNVTGVPSNGGTFEFQEAFIAKELENGLTMTFGQFKTPWMREELVDSSQQLAVERSTVNEFYNQDRAVGLMVDYATDSWNLAVSYNNGQRTALRPTGNRYSNFSNNQTDWSVSGRFEYKFSGDWSDFDSFTSSPGDEEAIMVGLAGMGQKYGEQSFLDGVKVYGITADVSAKFAGFSVFAAYVWQSYDTEAFNGNTEDYDPWGMVVQAGYSLNAEWELFARYEEGNANGANNNILGIPLAESGNPSILTFGANYFINDNVKFTVDWGINFADNMTIFADNSSDTGWTSSDEADQWVLRAQLQLLF
jgi:phosphate-selective porin